MAHPCWREAEIAVSHARMNGCRLSAVGRVPVTVRRQKPERQIGAAGHALISSTSGSGGAAVLAKPTMRLCANVPVARWQLAGLAIGMTEAKRGAPLTFLALGACDHNCRRQSAGIALFALFAEAQT